MRMYFDDESERALLAARLGYGESVGDAALAGALAAWFDDKPSPKRLTADDLEDARIVSDWSEVDEAEPGGYANNQTGWIGAG